ncbi:decarboxylase, partial [Rhizobium sp. SIMBA_035]
SVQPVPSDGRPLQELADALVGSAGETSGLALAEEILSRFEPLDDDGKLVFFRHLASAMNIAPDAVRATLETYERDPSKASY